MKRSVSICTVVLIFILSGCGKNSSLVPAIGKLTVDGKPAVGASILFHPAGGAPAKIGATAVSADGTFAVSTDGAPGIAAGTYDLSIIWPDPSVQPTEQQKMFGSFDPGPDLLKGRYATKDKAKLKIEISANSKELAPIELRLK